ncbi:MULTISPECIES: hypothetical protein [Shouchella]|uniref:Uncharacterized protein n=2 Tax=Shouchella TaxID=2893057 RepID=A0ABY7W9U2_9BACI|nr:MULTISPECIES: hypothetical protein [Shouchella]MED4129150.1 hypothetical protein [Shouchella miscanthi]WDF05692.1 hypothetical protein PQ477_09740 [Shouchella hunanensis]GAF20574.1 hypothetical protein JCM19047_220 [Bacillus sp. JCM 19047]
MDQHEAQQILGQLRSGEIKEVVVTKEQFTLFREVLVEQDDKKDFRGNAQHRGAVIYTYQPGWTA